MSILGDYIELAQKLKVLDRNIPVSCRLLLNMLNHVRSENVPSFDNFEHWAFWLLQQSLEHMMFTLRYRMDSDKLKSFAFQYENNEDLKDAVRALNKAWPNGIAVWIEVVEGVNVICFRLV